MFFDRSSRFGRQRRATESSAADSSGGAELSGSSWTSSSNVAKMVDDYYVRPQLRPTPPSSARGSVTNPRNQPGRRSPAVPDGQVGDESTWAHNDHLSTSEKKTRVSPPRLGRHTIFDQDLESPGPGTYSPRDEARVGGGALPFSSTPAEKRVPNTIEKEIPGPGRYYHASSLVKPSFNQLTNPNSRVSEERVVKKPVDPKHELIAQLEAAGSQRRRSGPHERRAVKDGMARLLSTLIALEAPISNETSLNER